MRWIVLIVLMWIAGPAFGQESQLHSDLRREGDDFAESCGELKLTAVPGCVVTIATDTPLHAAFGSFAPQNGFGFGLAFVEHYTPNERWRISWDADGVGGTSGAWRGGLYMKIIRTSDDPGIVVRTPGTGGGARPVVIRESPILNFYVQGMSLPQVLFFGLGADSTSAGRSVFSERQTIAGANAIVPVTVPGAIQALRPSVVGSINGRFVRVRGNSAESSPSIDELYDDRTAPGLSQQPTFVQFEEGFRIKPAVGDGRLQMNYLIDFQQFVADRAAQSSFHRWTVDLNHQIPLYKNVSPSGSKDTNGPDECFQSVGSTGCPPVSFSRNREGTIGFRLLTTFSTPSEGSAVPFYFQPTLGGTDINGESFLSSYADYRFRGTKLVALQESIEHSIWGPLGVSFMAEQGQVASDQQDLRLGDLAKSFSVGLTVRAGGFPLINLSFAWGSDGHHIIGTMDSSLLGGSSRPSLY